MATTRMTLRVLLPFAVFVEETGVSRVVAEAREGSFGILPRRMDCVAALAPGILTYETEADGEVFLAVDEGVLVKIGAEVRVSVRRAMRGADLDELRERLDHEFQSLSEQERSVRVVMARLETGFLRRLAGLRHD